MLANAYRGLKGCGFGLVLVLGCTLAVAVAASVAGTVMLSACDNPYVWSCGAPPPSKVAVTVDSETGMDGKSIKVDYDVEAGIDGGWMFCNIKVPADKKDWSTFQALSFSVRGDGGDNGIRIGLMDAEGELYLSRRVFQMTKTAWQSYAVKIAVDEDGFQPNTYYQPNGNKLTNPGVLDLQGIKEVSINIEDAWMSARKGWLHIDQITLE